MPVHINCEEADKALGGLNIAFSDAVRGRDTGLAKRVLDACDLLNLMPNVVVVLSAAIRMN